jgi:hypothetical protein
MHEDKRKGAPEHAMEGPDAMRRCVRATQRMGPTPRAGAGALATRARTASRQARVSAGTATLGASASALLAKQPRGSGLAREEMRTTRLGPATRAWRAAGAMVHAPGAQERVAAAAAIRARISERTLRGATARGHHGGVSLAQGARPVALRHALKSAYSPGLWIPAPAMAPSPPQKSVVRSE